MTFNEQNTIENALGEDLTGYNISSGKIIPSPYICLNFSLYSAEDYHG